MAEITSAAIGAVLGGLVVLIWNALGRRLGDDRFWAAFKQTARNLAAAPPPEQFFRQYAELLKALVAYIGKMTCRVGIAVLPVILACWMLAPVAWRWALRSADCLEVYPPQGLVVTIGDRTLALSADGIANMPSDMRRSPVRVSTPASAIDLSPWTGPFAASNSPWTTLGLQMLGLSACHAPDGPPLVIVRPYLADRNPARPILSDIEFSFWAGLICGSLIIGLVAKVKQR